MRRVPILEGARSRLQQSGHGVGTGGVDHDIPVRERPGEVGSIGKGHVDVGDMRRELADEKVADLDAQEDEILSRVQEGGDIDGDLRALYWQTTDDLERLLIETIVADMEQDTGLSLDPERPYELWKAALEDGEAAVGITGGSTLIWAHSRSRKPCRKGRTLS